MRRVAWAAGTRPELIKMVPVVRQLERRHDVELTFIWSGQHYDYEMSQIFMDELKLPEPDHRLGIGSQTDCDQISRTISEGGKIFADLKPDVVIAQGDTNTTAGVAIASSKKRVPFVHVEAGLRSFDRRMPEEINRMIASSCAELHFAPTQIARENLLNEGVPQNKIVVTGNTIVDVLKEMLPSLDLPEEPERKILATIHRQESVDSPEALSRVVKVLRDLSEVAEIFMPLHPRTKNRLVEFGLWDSLNAIEDLSLMEPLGYKAFLQLMAGCRLVLTDSGGVQEEAYVLDIPTLTLRDNTERPETVTAGRNHIIGENPNDVAGKASKLMAKMTRRKQLIPNALGDGNAGALISEALLKRLDEGLTITHTVDITP